MQTKTFSMKTDYKKKKIILVFIKNYSNTYSHNLKMKFFFPYMYEYITRILKKN